MSEPSVFESTDLLSKGAGASVGRTSVRLFRAWHRKLAWLAILPLIWFSITGVLLNHTDDLSLGARPLTGIWLKLYGVEPTSVTSTLVFESYVSRTERQFYLDAKPVAECSSRALAALPVSSASASGQPNLIASVCASQVSLITDTGELVEVLQNPLSSPIESARVIKSEALVLNDQSGAYVWDLVNLQLTPYEGGSDTPAQADRPVELPEALEAKLTAQLIVPGLTAERLIQDLHAFRFLPLGRWLLDLSALLLIVLSITGFRLLGRGKLKR